MRVAIVYDCMFPYTVGGAERWYVQLAERFSDDNEVTYLTLRQWPRGETPTEPCKVVEVGPQLELYTESGRRRIWPPVRFGLGVFWHLLLHGGRYDVVHGASFPYFSVIGAKIALAFHRRTKLVIDWHEVWSREYWNEYLGSAGGRVGYAIQSFCKRLPDHNFTESHMHAERLAGHPLTQLTGLFVEGQRPSKPVDVASPPHAIFAGRHIPEKNVVALPAALVEARKSIPDLRATIFGSGPESERVSAEIDRLDAADFISMPGRVEADVLDQAFASAACMVLPSTREGYGMVVLEAVSQGVPAVLVADADNAATELVEDGVNGFVAATPDPSALGAAISAAVSGGPELRTSTWQWYEDHRESLSIDDSVAKIKTVYSRLTAAS